MGSSSHHYHSNHMIDQGSMGGGLRSQAVKLDDHYNYLYQDHHYHYHCDHEQGSMGGLGWEAELWDAWPQLSNHSLHSVAWLQRWILF